MSINPDAGAVFALICVVALAAVALVVGFWVYDEARFRKRRDAEDPGWRLRERMSKGTDLR